MKKVGKSLNEQDAEERNFGVGHTHTYTCSHVDLVLKTPGNTEHTYLKLR